MRQCSHFNALRPKGAAVAERRVRRVFWCSSAISAWHSRVEGPSHMASAFFEPRDTAHVPLDEIYRAVDHTFLERITAVGDERYQRSANALFVYRIVVFASSWKRDCGYPCLQQPTIEAFAEEQQSGCSRADIGTPPSELARN